MPIEQSIDQKEAVSFLNNLISGLPESLEWRYGPNVRPEDIIFIKNLRTACMNNEKWAIKEANDWFIQHQEHIKALETGLIPYREEKC